MQKDDLVYAGHMLDMARKALGLIHGKSRAEYEQDDALSLALTTPLPAHDLCKKLVADGSRYAQSEPRL